MSYKNTQTVIKLITDMFVVVIKCNCAITTLMLFQHVCTTPGMQLQHMPGCFCVLLQHTTFTV